MKRFWERPLPAEVPRIELRQYTGYTVFDSWKSSFFFSFFLLFFLYIFFIYFLYPNGFFPLIFPLASRGYAIRVFLVKFCCSKPCMSEKKKKKKKKKTRTISTDFWQVKPNIRSSFKQFGKPYQGMTSLYSMLSTCILFLTHMRRSITER